MGAYRIQLGLAHAPFVEVTLIFANPMPAFRQIGQTTLSSNKYKNVHMLFKLMRAMAIDATESG